MRYSPEQKEKTRQRIIAAAERGFKRGGYAGLGVDGLAREAGVTSGAFYGHFPSKQAAFRAAITSGLGTLSEAVARFQRDHGEHWWPAFIRFYTGQKRTCDAAESCALQSLAPEVARADAATRVEFEAALGAIVAQMAGGGGDRAAISRERVWAILAMLIGGVTLARAVEDRALAEEIATAVEETAITLSAS